MRGWGGITLLFKNRALPGPDHKASLGPDELKMMVEGIRAAEAALGDGTKQPQPSELKNIDIARKSLVALKPVKSGEPFTHENIGCKRPGTGMSPMMFWELLGEIADRDLSEEQQL